MLHYVNLSLNYVRREKYEKIFSCIITAVLAAANMTTLVSAAEKTDVTTFVYDGLEYEIVGDLGLQLSGCADKTATSVTIPAEIDGKIVGGGSYSYFGDCPNLIEINVDDDNMYLEDIDGVLFDKIYNILIEYPRGRSGDYVIPDGTEMIADSAFKNAVGLTTVTVPDSLKSTGFSAFENCTSLTEFINGIPITFGGTISGCTALKSLTLAEMPIQTMLANLHIDNCKSLESVTIPDCYTLDDGFTLRYCPEITEIKLPETAHASNIIIFECNKLSSVELPKVYTKSPYATDIFIGNCESIISLDITTNMSLTFENLTSLETIRLYDSNAGKLTIKDCENLQSITCNMSSASDNINYFTCPNFKDVYIYDEASGWIPDTYMLAMNNITVHCMKSNTAIQKYLTKYDVNFVFIDDEILAGDANCDSEVSMADAVLIMQSLSNPDKYGLGKLNGLTLQGRLNADVVGNDGVTNKDALVIQQYMLGLINSLPK